MVKREIQFHASKVNIKLKWVVEVKVNQLELFQTDKFKISIAFLYKMKLKSEITIL